MSNYKGRLLAFRLFHRSLLLFATALFWEIYFRTQSLYPLFPIFRVAVILLWIFLFYKWATDFLRNIPGYLSHQMRLPLMFIKYLAIIYVLLEWAFGASSIILSAVRLLFEIIGVLWCIRFWKTFKKLRQQSAHKGSRLITLLLPCGMVITYIIAFGGLFLEIMGHGTWAFNWYLSWSLTSMVFLWGYLFLLVLQEWNHHLLKSSATVQAEASPPTYPIQWFFNRMCWLVGLGLFIFALIFSWDIKDVFLHTYMRIFNYTFKAGSMTLSLMGFVSALLTLFFTHLAINLWKYFLHRKIFPASGIEPGLQESITTISIYFFWAIGILFALHVFGLNTTSLTVVFGALGIGLGFGLQNIFNNFISGLILLFERPIQVGDALEIDGIWGTVKKINVRATVVQTYDNASFIIPNSDLITTKVTNWSFKDLKVRRKIVVGVAYGSDVELVKHTLLEVAAKTPKILKSPQSDVLFSDFGDSALIFTLRIWTNVDYALSVETDVRFEINRLFNERNIEIAFPQRDIHIRTTYEKEKEY
ncbi:MAG: mechanosensitive ion channel family protein [bacterium]